MSRRQWLWLWVWLLLFFIIFCVWNKLQELNDTKTVTKPTATTATTQSEPAKTALKHSQEKKDINIKVLKDKDSVKISGIFNSKEDLEALKSEYKKISKDVKEGMIIIDKNAQNEKILKLFPTLNSEFSKFKNGFLEYKEGEMTMSGRVDDEEVKQNLHNKLLSTGNIKIDNQLIVEKSEVKKAEVKQEIKSIEKSPPKVEKPKEVVQKEPKPIVKKISKKEIQEKLDNLFKLSKVEFVYAKDALTPKGKDSIDKVYTVLNEHKEIKVEIGGHTDSDGTEQNNKRLSQKRADAIRKYLITKGIKGYRLKAIGYGESMPLVKNSSLENKQINRRVEFKIIGD